jgi:benzylsuccinate CoA-transferase BbsF subunit
MFDQLNVGKRSVSLDLKHPDGKALAVRIIEWADAVAENFAPKAMRGLGLDYESLVTHKPDLVMISACLNGQTGPHRDYPGFGGQGSALSGFNILTGWPDREPIGPSGTITDSLAPRFVAAALAAALLRHRRTGEGVHLDLSQVEAAAWTLTPWLADYDLNDHIAIRDGNRDPRAELHAVLPARGDDRWVAVAAWTPQEWRALAELVGADEAEADPDAREAAVAAWTGTRDAVDAADHLQGLGIEAVPVADYRDVHDDPQLASRNHLQAFTHPVMGPGDYERNGFRLSDTPSGYDRPSPTIGQHNDWMLGDVLGLGADEIAALAADGALD